jgi:gliding motility-associated-like protein
VVTVINNPTIVVTPSAISICPGEQSTLNASGGTTYHWVPATTLSSATDSTVVATPSGTLTYTITGMTMGCSGTATSTVTVKPLPQLSVTPTTPAICIHNNLTLTATGADTYVWSPDSTLSSSTGSSVIADPLSSCTYYLSGTLNGCTDSIQIPFVVNPLPVITIQANPSSGCQPFTTTLSATSTPVAQGYSWTIDGTGYSDPSPTVMFPNSGQYNVSLMVTDNNNCVNSVSEPNFITVYPKPTVTFTYTPEVGALSKPVVFTSSISAPGSQYFWNFGDGQTATETTENTTHNYGVTGTLSVTHVYVNEFGCKDTAFLPINVVINVVIPNIFTPNGDGQNDTFIIDGLQNVEGAVMKIYNRWGRKVFESENYKNDWDGGDFADGVYFFILTLPDNIEAGPFNGSVTLLR